jgi:hypothetical protein
MTSPKGKTNPSPAGYTNVTTSDSVVHAQVKQSGKFSFLRIYESGHEVPFYQPLLALEMFERALGGLDIATGTEIVDADYLSVGTPTSTYREGNATIQLSITPSNETYDVYTGQPINGSVGVGIGKRSLGEGTGMQKKDRRGKLSGLWVK